MSNKAWPGPPGGVSSINEGGGRTAIQDADVPKKGKGVRRSAGDDVLKNVHELPVESQGNVTTPTGVQSTERDVRIGQMPRTKKSRRNTKSFRSVDGELYTFRSHDSKGKELPENRLFMLVAALRETTLGGNAKVVFDAWGLNVKDMDGKQFYPVSNEVLERMMAEQEVLEARGELEEDPDQQMFALGEAE
jgi:hypothetical protein